MRTAQLERVLQIMRAAQESAPCTSGRFAAEFGVSRRTVFRDFALLRNAGIEIGYDTDSGCLKIDNAIATPPRLSVVQLLLLVTSCLTSPLYTDTPKEIDSGLDSLLKKLPMDERLKVERLRSMLQATVARESKGVIRGYWDIFRAMADSAMLEIVERNPQADLPITHVVTPVGVRVGEDVQDIHLECVDYPRNKSRIIRLKDIEQVRAHAV